MMDEPTSQRFRDPGGWWRNQRGVRVEAEALVIERWLGGELRVPWVDVVGVRWSCADVVEVDTPDRMFLFDRHVAGLESLAQALNEARAAAHAVAGEGDVMRWLGHEYHVSADVESGQDPMARDIEQAALTDPLPRGRYAIDSLMLRGMVLIIANLFDMVCALPRIAKKVLGRPVPMRELTVDHVGVTMAWPAATEKLAWAEIDACERTPEGGLVLLPKQGADSLLIPAEPDFGHAMEAIERVLRGLSEAHLEAVPPPPGALSLAREAGGEDADSRSLSRAEPEEPAP